MASGKEPFELFIGNASAASVVHAALVSGKGAHAYLLTGPDQVGKRAMAQMLAAGLVCELQTAPATSEPIASAPQPLDLGLTIPGLDLPAAASNQDTGATWESIAALPPCGACRACLKAAKGAHPDIHLVAPEATRRGIVIEQVRQLEHAAGLRPYEAHYKAFILLNVEAMTEAAANALLKTLEEPPQDTVLILTASDSAQVLPTIASRCQEVALRPVPAEEIAAGLVTRGVDAAQAQLLARLAAGRPGWALAAASDPSLLEARQEQLSSLEQLLPQPPVRRLPIAATFSDAASTKAVLDLWLTWWRDALLVKQGCADLIANVDRLPQLEQIGATHSTHACWQALKRIQETRQQIDANANVRLAVEGLLLALPQSQMEAN